MHQNRVTGSFASRLRPGKLATTVKWSIKVTVYLHRCLAYERCSASVLKLQIPKPPYQIKAYRVGYQTISSILQLNELLDFPRPLKSSVRITFSKLQVKANFAFRYFILLLRFRTQSAKKTCLRLAILSNSEKLKNVFEIVF